MEPRMSLCRAFVQWTCTGDFRSGRYSRIHDLRFDGGMVVKGSSSPDVVPLPFSAPEGVDPEELFTASLAACHMLWFLHRARDAGFWVLRYSDAPEGVLSAGEDGRERMTLVTLRPRAAFQGAAPDADALRRLHEAAHETCFIAQSVTTKIRIEPQGETAA